MKDTELDAIEAQALDALAEPMEQIDLEMVVVQAIPTLVAEVRRLSGDRFVCTSCGEVPNDCECVQEEAVPWWKPGWTS